MTPEIDYNPFASRTLKDPFAEYDELREKCPVHKFDDFSHPLFTVTRYEDVVQLLTNIDMWSSHYGQMPRYSVQGCLFSDPPQHTWYRKLIQKSFAPRHVAAMESEISSLVDQLLDEMESRNRSDLHDALACPLPVLVIAKILGVPTDDIDQFKAWSDQQLAEASAPDMEAPKAARKAMEEYLLQQIDIRREALIDSGYAPETADQSTAGTVLPDDVITGILLAEVDGRKLGDTERLVMLNQLLVGGNETTTSLLTNIFWRLLENPELYNQVRDDPTLDTVAIEESLRMDAPVLGLYRTNTEETVFNGVRIPERSKVMATFGAANRDPEIFEDPNTFRLDRNPDELRKHVAFGLGHHFCPGAQLSRLEAKIALRAVANRFPNLRLDGEPQRIAPFLLWGKKSLPVRWD
tara:strand:- start:2607 stop:3830 length:1224 start_codon:yes stop_codon:yes gene_type:complete